MPTVYVVQENPRMNYLPAEKFGEVKFLTASEFSASQHSLRNKQILEQVMENLSNFDPDKDYLVLSGNPIIMGFVFSLLIQKKGYLRVLWYHSIDREYVEVNFNPSQILSMSS
ncbi:hypothetical protein IBZ20DMU1_29 [Acinetobacter phage DMU1]|nr:hypothetical protein IBZ20DMU1_29 [Acinetobacter phage DMU1]